MLLESTSQIESLLDSLSDMHLDDSLEQEDGQLQKQVQAALLKQDDSVRDTPGKGRMQITASPTTRGPAPSAKSPNQRIDDRLKQESAKHTREMNELRKTLSQKITMLENENADLRRASQDESAKFKADLRKVREKEANNHETALRRAVQEEANKHRNELNNLKKNYQQELGKHRRLRDREIASAIKNQQAEDREAYGESLQQSIDHYEQKVQQLREHAGEAIKQERFHAASEGKERQLANQKLGGYENEIERLEAQIRKLQEGSLRTVDPAHWAPESAAEIDRKLKSLLSGARQWSERFAKFPVDHVLEAETFAHIAALLIQRQCIGKEEKLYERLSESRTMQKPGKAASLLLSSALSADLFHKVVGDAFFAFVGQDQEVDLLRETERHAVLSLCNQILPSDDAGAHNWRATLLRLLNPQATDEASGAVLAVKEISLRSRLTAAKRFANDFVQEFTNLLIPSNEADNATAALEELAGTAAELSWRLWSRKTCIGTLDFHSLTESLGSLKYGNGSELIEAHSLHSARLEDDPSSLDGSEIVLFCNPAVQAWGNAEGGEYHKRALWRKAVVWLG